MSQYVKAASTAFWDSCLTDSAAATQYLRDAAGLESFAGTAAEVSFK
jgi:hypothetical protein